MDLVNLRSRVATSFSISPTSQSAAREKAALVADDAAAWKPSSALARDHQSNGPRICRDQESPHRRDRLSWLKQGIEQDCTRISHRTVATPAFIAQVDRHEALPLGNTMRMAGEPKGHFVLASHAHGIAANGVDGDTPVI